jgi:formylglycine-generating enzyme required for sulfatase activity
VTFQDLAGYLSEAVVNYSVRTGRVQRPFDAGEASGDFLISGAPRGAIVTASPAVTAPTAGSKRGDTKTGKDGVTYVWIPPGTFTMGCSPGDTECSNNEKPAHQVTLTKGFWMGQMEVTQEAYQRVIGSNPSHFKGARLPVETINWNEAQSYCQAAGMRLPTEAEWEYAARGGDSSARYGALDAIAWHDTNSGNQTHDVGQKQANGFGLHDMLGNVWEWVADWYQDRYPAGPATDPQGPSSGQYRVLRGGSWGVYPRISRASDRYGNVPVNRSFLIGVRCVGE